VSARAQVELRRLERSFCPVARPRRLELGAGSLAQYGLLPVK